MTEQPETIRKSLLPCIPPPEWEFHTVLGARADSEGCALFPGDTGPVVVRRLRTYGDWEPVCPDRWAPEPPTAGAPAVSAGVAPATDEASPSRRAGLHDEIAAALYENLHPGSHWSDTSMPADWRPTYLEEADVVLAVLYREWPWLRAEAEDAAVLPASVDRADALREEAAEPAPIDRAALSAKLWEIAEQHIVAEWICCEPLEPRHTLCAKGYAALGMARTLLVDSPEAWNPEAPLLNAVVAELRRVAADTPNTTKTRTCDCPTEDAPEHMFSADGCTCRPWTRQTTPPRYLDQPGDTVDMVSGWERGADCPHHAPAGGAPQPKETDDPWAAGERLAQTGIDTPGCDCGHDGMGESWHGDGCGWKSIPPCDHCGVRGHSFEDCPSTDQPQPKEADRG